MQSKIHLSLEANFFLGFSDNLLWATVTSDIENSQLHLPAIRNRKVVALGMDTKRVQLNFILFESDWVT